MANKGTIMYKGLDLSNGGSGGTGLPEVTTEDDGKVLKVVDGEWSAIKSTSELPTITSEDNGKILTVINEEPAWTDNNIYIPQYSTSTVIDGKWYNNTNIYKQTLIYTEPVELESGQIYATNILASNINEIISSEAISSDGANLSCVDAILKDGYVQFGNNYSSTVYISKITIRFVKSEAVVVNHLTGWSVGRWSGISTEAQEDSSLKISIPIDVSTDGSWRSIDFTEYSLLEVVCKVDTKDSGARIGVTTNIPDWNSPSFGYSSSIPFSDLEIDEYKTITFDVSSLQSTTLSVSSGCQHMTVAIYIKEINLYAAKGTDNPVHIVPTYDSSTIDFLLSDKQYTLIAGDNITIAEDGRTISAVGGSGDVTKEYVDNEIKNSLLELEPHIVEELPEASISNYTKFYIVTDDDGNDRLFINLKNNNAYGWFEFKQSDTTENTARLGQAIIGTLVLGKE